MLRDAQGTAVKVIGVSQDITQRKETEIALRASEGRIRTVINSTLALVGVLDPDGLLREVNQPALDFGGLGRDDVIGKPFWECFWWAHDAQTADMCHRSVTAAQGGQTARYDVVVRGAGDRLITIDFLLAPVFDQHGKLEMLVASGFDISAREEARAHAQALMGEINHRTKNILTLVQVLARQTARGGAEDFVSRFQDRLLALSQAQDLLIEGMVDSVDIHDLARSQLGHFGDLADTRIRLAGPPLSLAPHAAQAIGMALHELATNAGKYGALSVGAGRVDISWQLHPPTGNADGMGEFEMCWAESCGPPVAPPSSTGFGSKVISQMIQSALDAQVTLDFAPEGVRWHMTCPASDLKQRK